MSQPKGKKKFLLWAYPSTIDLIKTNYKKDRCRSQSEFIERAVQYYAGKVTASVDTSYLPNAIMSNLKSIISHSDSKTNNILFKIAIELAMIMNILAATNEFDKETVSELRENCIKEVRRLGGNFTFEDAVEWQR